MSADASTRKALIWGAGRLSRLLAYKTQHNVSAMMINVEMLSPMQQAELSAVFRVPVFDRYNIVLLIFKAYARTREAHLQIALAEIPYIRQGNCARDQRGQLKASSAACRGGRGGRGCDAD